MTVKTSLFAGAAVLALTGAAGAEAAPVRHHARHAAAKPSAEKGEVAELKAQVAELTARLDAQEEAQRATQAQASVAQTQAADATVKADTAQSTALAAQQAAPKQVADAISKLPKPKPSWADSTTLSGRMYFNFSNINQFANGVRSANDGTGFDIKRFYLGVDHKFSNVFAANLTMDVSNVVGNTSNNNFPGAQANTATTTGACVTTVGVITCPVPAEAITNNLALVGRGFYIKKAYLQATLSPALVIRAGAADLPWVPYVEGQYGYRHIENTLIDRTGFGTSSDWGVHVLGDLFDKIVSYQVSVIDGGGYRNVKVTNSVDVEGRVSAQYQGIWGAVGGYTGKRAANIQGLVLPTGLAQLHTATRLDAAAGYKTALFNVGGEYFHAKDWNNVATLVQDKSSGYSLFGNVNPIPKWSAFGRYDWVKPNELTNGNLKDHYFNVGLQYEPVKIVDLALVYKRDVANNGLFATQNGTIGGANAAGQLVGGRGTYDEIGLFGQLRF